MNQAERAEDMKQKELIHALKVENVDLNLKISEMEKEMVNALYIFLFN
jgi:ribosomal protein L20